MTKLSSKLSRLLSRFRKVPWKFKLLLGAGILLMAVAGHLVVALVSVTPAEIKLAELKDSWDNEAICHEQCSRWRQEAEDMIIASLRLGNNPAVSRRLESYFVDSQTKDNFRIELISILAEASGKINPPEYIRRYLADLSVNPTVQAAIIDAYDPAALAWPLSPDSSVADYYLEVIGGERDILIKQAALRALSNYQADRKDFTLSQLDRFKKIIFNPQTDPRLRPELIMALGDYYESLPAETGSVLRTIYKTEVNGDEISRAFAADILNRKAGDSLVIPEIPESEWARYYNY